MGPSESQSLQVFEVGIRYEPLGQELLGPTTEDKIEIKHWSLVFEHVSDSETIYQLDIGRVNDKISVRRQQLPAGSLTAHLVGYYMGYIHDLSEILAVHPMRRTKYDESFNNCQHWVAIFLRFFLAASKAIPNRHFKIINHQRWDIIQSVLSSNGSNTLYNRPNARLQAVYMKTAASVALSSGVAAILAESVVTSVVPASGLAGLLGVTTTIVTPAAYAGFAAVTAPLAGGLAAITASAYGYKYVSWRKASTFADPLEFGFPTRRNPRCEEESSGTTDRSTKYHSGKSLLISLTRDFHLF